MSEMNQDLLAEIDNTLKAELSITPSADFEARVLRTIEARAAARSWWMPSYAFVAAAAAVVITTTLAIVMLRPAADGPLPVSARAGSDVRLATEPRTAAPRVPNPEARTSSREPQAQSTERRAPSAERRTPAEPEVIVPLNQLAAVRRLVRDVNEGRISHIPDALPEPTPATTALVVAPLVVEPIALPDAEKGGGISPVVRGF